MPAKKKRAGKKGGKRKGKKGAKAASEKEEALKKCRDFLKAYQHQCSLPGRIASQTILSQMREGVENEKPPVKFVLDASVLQSTLSSGPRIRTAKSAERLSPASMQDSLAHTPSLLSATPPPSHMLLQPLVNSWVETRYSLARCLHVWSTELTDDAIVSLAFYFESTIGCHLKVLELKEVNISPWSVNRLARSLQRAQLSVLNLDYNRISQLSLAQLCDGLQRCQSVQTLSLNYCQLDSSCGETLGSYLATSNVRELSLMGNTLQCDGCVELIRPLVALCDASSALSLSEPTPQHKAHSDVDGSKKLEPNDQMDDKMEADKVHLPSPLAKLFLQDNCIDIHGRCVMSGSFETVICARALKRFLINSPFLEEVNLAGNLLGDGGGREVMLGLQMRKEMGLPDMKMTVSSSISPEIFSSITKLSSGTKKKGKKKGKKKKKT